MDIEKLIRDIQKEPINLTIKGTLIELIIMIQRQNDDIEWLKFRIQTLESTRNEKIK